MAAPLEHLRQRGYVTFPSALDTEMCGRLMKFALCTPSVVSAHGPRARWDARSHCVLRSGASAGGPLRLSDGSSLNNADVQALLGDPSCLALAQQYLGSRPRADVLSMWWHTNFHGAARQRGGPVLSLRHGPHQMAQVFIYLTTSARTTARIRS
jgi:hypothetical protein